MEKRKRYAFFVSTGRMLKMHHLLSAGMERPGREFIFLNLSEFSKTGRSYTDFSLLTLEPAPGSRISI